jgi:hypothetical protein
MTNIIKTTLVEKQIATTDKINNLLSAEKEIIANRVKIAFKEAFDYLPVEVTLGYDSIYFKVDRREILSICKRYVGEPYLNTYATSIEDDFELKRLIFNGMVAKAVLENPNVYKEIFADTEFKEEITEVREQLHALQSEIKAIENAEKAKATEEKLEKLKKGEEIGFDKPKDITYSSGKYGTLRRVIGMKAEWISNKKVNVTFTCKSWDEAQPDTKYFAEGIHEKYVLNII